jgi:glucokinase
VTTGDRAPRRCLLGLDLGGTKLAAALATTEGEILAVRQVPTLAPRGAEQALARALDAGRTLADASNATVAAVGVSTMGITHEDHVELAPNVPGWHTLALPALVRAAFSPAPVQIGNDVKAAALAELTWGELAGVDGGIYLNVGTGLAAALTLGGRVLTGAHEAAGEIGYWLRSRTDGPGAAAGRAPLEEHVAGAGTTARAERELGVDGGVAVVATRDDAAATAFLEDLYDEIGLHLANLAIAFDPERVVVGGGYAGDSERLLTALRGWLDRCVPFPPQLRLARFLRDSGLAGAVALALQVYEP